MIHKKRRAENFEFTEPEAIAAHLSKMAARGWQLESISRFGWVYRMAAPQRLTYAVVYFPDVSAFDAGPTRAHEEYFAYCEAAGWHRAAAWFQMDIFCTEAECPTPLETDEAVKLKTIHQAMKRNFLPGYAVLLALFAIMLCLILPPNLRAPLQLLSSNSTMSFLLLLVGMITYLAYMLLRYLFWFRRSKQSVAAGGACRRQTGKRRKIFSTLLSLLLVLFLAASAVDIAHSPASGTILKRMALWGGCMAALLGVLSVAKRLGLDRKNSRRAYVGTAIVVCILFFALAPDISVRKAVPPSELPLPGSEFGYYEDGSFGFLDRSSSILLAREDGYQAHDTASVSYVRYLPRFHWVYHFCMYQLLDTQEWGGIPSGAWNADAVYYRQDGECHSYLICYPDRLLRIEFFPAPPSDAQITAVVQHLCT